MGCVNFSPPPLHRVIPASSVTQVDLTTQRHLVIHRPPPHVCSATLVIISAGRGVIDRTHKHAGTDAA